MDVTTFRRLLMMQCNKVPGEPEEIRIRAGKPVLFTAGGREYALKDESGAAASADSRLIRALLEQVTCHSLYAYEEEMRQGFLTVEGGHRIGLAGKVVAEGNTIRTLRDVSGLNIRLAREMTGCADAVMPWLYDEAAEAPYNTLLISPPGAGKTTLLRDIVRQASAGDEAKNRPGVSVSVVDERSELAACLGGVAQKDLGPRTDVLDGCPKAVGMMMAIRSLAPKAVAVDEIGTKEDLEALTYVINCGCRILATAHGSSVEELKNKPVLSRLVRERVFSRYVVLAKALRPGTVLGIFDEELRKLPLSRAACL